MNEISTRPSAVVHVTRGTGTFFFSSLRLHLLEQSDEIESRLSKSQSSPPTVGSTLFLSEKGSNLSMSLLSSCLLNAQWFPLKMRRHYAITQVFMGLMAQSFRDSLRKGKQKNDRQVKKKRMESKIYLEKNEQHAKGWTYIWSYSSTPFALFLPSSYSHDLINQDDGGIAPCVYATPPPSSSPFPISVSFP